MYALVLIELFVKALKEGWNGGFDPSLRKLHVDVLLAPRVWKFVLEVG